MSFWARLKSKAGGETPPDVVLGTGSTKINLTSNRDVYYLNASNTCTIGTVGANDPVLPGRTILFVGKIGTAAVTFTNANDTTTKGAMDLGGSDATIDDQDTLELMQHPTGAWVALSQKNN